jgi:peroxiredoxin
MAAVALLISAAAFGQRQPAGQSPESLEGKPAPDFSLKTLEGKEVKLSDQKGKVVLIDIWATWCPPCRESLPHLQAIATDTTLADKGLVVWAVNAREGKDKIEPFMKENKYSFTVPMDSDGAVMKKYFVTGIPTTLIIGRDGNVKKAIVGFGPGGEKAIHDAVVKALEEEAPEA